MDEYRTSVQSHQRTILQLPLHLQSRLSPTILSLSLSSLFSFHSLVSLIISSFSIHPSYALPLSLTGLIVSNLSTSLVDLLPIFTTLHFLSILLDLFWLTFSTSSTSLQYKDGDVMREIQGESINQLCVFLVGINMIFKLFSLVNCSMKLKELGIIEDVTPYGLGPTGYTPFGYNANQNQQVPGGYQTIYDEEAIDSYQSQSRYASNQASTQPSNPPAPVNHGGSGYGRAQAQHGRNHSESDAKILSSLDSRLNPMNLNPQGSTSNTQHPIQSSSQTQVGDDQNQSSGNGYHSID